jgi:uncharacterized membrane protein
MTGVSLLVAFRVLANRESGAHRQTMQYLYIGACIVAGAFTLLPSRYLGQWIWRGWLKLPLSHQ